MEQKYKGILFVTLAALLSATSQLLFKHASSSLTFSLASIVTNIPLIIGFALYGLVALLFVTALKYGELTVLYPLLATTYIWVAIASPLVFPTDSLNPLKIVGILVVIFGVYSISKGMKPHAEVS